jgi:hypothetical protein
MVVHTGNSRYSGGGSKKLVVKPKILSENQTKRKYSSVRMLA